MLLSNPRVCKSPTLLVPLESYLYLQDRCRFERCGNHHSEMQRQKLSRNFEQFAYNGKKQLCNGDLGGCNGKPENAWEEGRWTSWSVEDMIRILDEAGLPWERGEETEYIAL